MGLLYIQSPTSEDYRVPGIQTERSLWVWDVETLFELALRTCIHIARSLLPDAFIFSCSLYQFPEYRCRNSILIQKMFAGYVQWNYNLVLILTLNTESEHKSGV